MPPRSGWSGGEHDGTADVVLLCFGEQDGDLVDARNDAGPTVVGGRHIWLLPPESGRDGYAEPSDIAEALPTAGLARTLHAGAGPDWTAKRLVDPKSARTRRR
ncbi:DUF3052 family protein [Streptomyces bobili]|uniref:DUF3052 family protein n=1 Tax=Streptomyces bobili TaxID=67280 RepID=UPI0033A5A0D2